MAAGSALGVRLGLGLGLGSGLGSELPKTLAAPRRLVERAAVARGSLSLPQARSRDGNLRTSPRARSYLYLAWRFGAAAGLRGRRRRRRRRRRRWRRRRPRRRRRRRRMRRCCWALARGARLGAQSAACGWRPAGASRRPGRCAASAWHAGTRGGWRRRRGWVRRSLPCPVSTGAAARPPHRADALGRAAEGR